MILVAAGGSLDPRPSFRFYKRLTVIKAKTRPGIEATAGG